MYDRYTIFSSQEQLEKNFNTKSSVALTTTYNAAPTHLLPVITSAAPEEIQLFHWGLISQMANNKAISPRLFNLPVGTAVQRPMYRKSIENSRCLILANGFYVWKQVSKKQRVPYFCYFKENAPFAIAGVWEEFDDLEGNTAYTFNMITVPASGALSDYQDDMPALLSQAQCDVWLDENANIEKLQPLLSQLNLSNLLMHAVSPLLAAPKNNGEQLIAPAAPSDQFGNYTLFS
ncbi:SOS response-associated peptidase [Marinoscillum furvescens]|uniref:Abasic site processing protein n=1 Tax=Marinoscillum furvescens DSM 4134 TaxID=1122208 RepID=A0A3D9LG29_MARFU|nr:SOS response-associated peptidase [Marinoscillum furvescens]REE05557.1 putative SOS response-associated peptidase YedK [Marinoscillum furvescens DSM 4134]